MGAHEWKSLWPYGARGSALGSREAIMICLTIAFTLIYISFFINMDLH